MPLVYPYGFLTLSSSAYQITRSLRFNSADTTKLTRTPAGAGNRRKMTISFWSKKCVIQAGASYDQILVQNSGVAGGGSAFSWNAPDDFICYMPSGMNLVTRGKNRDPAAWDHLVIGIDTDQTTATDRVKIYRNGSDDTLTSGTYPTLNVDLTINQAVAQYIGGNSADSFKANVYLAEMYFIDGQQLTASSFGETDSVTGAWVPKAYTGTYGTNGFYLDFSDNSNTTSSTLGKDRSGNNNDWTPSNFSVTAGVGNDSLTDTPTNYGTDTGAGGEVRGNYATLNPLMNRAASGACTNGNLLWTATGVNDTCISTFGMLGGKWYWEVHHVQVANENFIGILPDTITKTKMEANTQVGTEASDGGYGLRDSNGQKYFGGTGAAYVGSGFTTAVIGVAVDFTGAGAAGKIWWSVSGVWAASGDPAAGTDAAYTDINTALTWFAASSVRNGATDQYNFGQRPFAATAPSGFKALCTQNLPTPAIAKPKLHFDTAIYTGTGASLAISTDGSTANNTLALAPDLVWLKGRSGATDHAIYDNVRGVQKDWGSNLTTDETSQAQGVTAFGSTGFTVGTLAKLNTSAATYVSWLWKAGGAAASNTVGSITSSVSVNTTAGVSALTYTGTGANATIGHGIGVAPSMVIVKARTTAGADQGAVLWHASLTTPTTDYLVLSTTAALASAATMWNSTIPTSTVFSVGTNASTNTSGDTYVAYAFSPVDGFSAFGKYTGNAAADGPFVWCGFRPRWFMVKCASATNNWVIFDAARSTYNATNEELYADVADAGGSNNRGPDFLSNGVKIRATTSFQNSSGATYVFAAFAESPFKSSRAR